MIGQEAANVAREFNAQLGSDWGYPLSQDWRRYRWVRPHSSVTHWKTNQVYWYRWKDMISKPSTQTARLAVSFGMGWLLSLWLRKPRIRWAKSLKWRRRCAKTPDFTISLISWIRHKHIGAYGRLAQDDSRYGQQPSTSKTWSCGWTPDCLQTCHCVPWHPKNVAKTQIC